MGGTGYLGHIAEISNDPGHFGAALSGSFSHHLDDWLGIVNISNQFMAFSVQIFRYSCEKYKG